jgi:hypothetical protein
MTAALRLPTTRPPSLTLEDLEAFDEWRKPKRALTHAEAEAAFVRPDFSTARSHDDSAEPRQDRHRPLGQLSAVDPWIPDYEPEPRLPEWMDGAIR